MVAPYDGSPEAADAESANDGLPGYPTHSTMIDIHSHLIPAVDDGPASLAECLDGLKQLDLSGISAAVATPHLNASMIEDPTTLGRYLDRVDAQWLEMTASAANANPELELRRGFEIMLDRPKPDFSDERLRLAKTRFVLVEFPWSTIPPNSARALSRTLEAGFIPIVSHPERYEDRPDGWASLREWRDAGALLQVNLGSIVGDYGNRAQRSAWTILEHGLADYLASDFHCRGRHPLERARKAMLERGASEPFEILTVTNPRRLLDDALPVTVPPIAAAVRSEWRPFRRT